LKLFLKYGEQLPFKKIVTHRYKIQEAETALKKSMDEDTMKVVIEP